jgi:hypothetical protein
MDYPRISITEESNFRTDKFSNQILMARLKTLGIL